MKPQHDIGDSMLLELLTGGDEKAFALICAKYVPELFRLVKRNIGSAEDAEEILQDIFESLWRRRQELQHISSLGGYLHSSAKYKIMRYFRHKAVINRYDDHYRLFEVVYDTLSDEDKNSETVHERILQAMSQLPVRCQEAVRLRLMENLSNEDIADRMNIKKDTVENYIVSAVRFLRENLGKLSSA